MYMNQEILTEEEINLIKEMEKPNNHGGFERMFHFCGEEKEEFSLERFLLPFSDVHVEDFILVVSDVDGGIPQMLKTLYKEYGEKQFIYRIKYLAQVSIKNRVLSGKVTDEFIKNVVDITDIRWVKKELETNPQVKGLKILYFFRRFYDVFWHADYRLRASTIQRNKLRREYIKSAHVISIYIIDLFNTDDMRISGQIAEKILRDLKNSF